MQVTDKLEGYNVSDFNEVSATELYAGYLRMDGSWYIMHLDGNAIRYAKGLSGYATNWTNRILLSYSYYSDIF